MNDLIPTVINIVFLIIIGALSLLLALCVYIYVRYGRTPSITITSSIVIVIIFISAVFAALTTTQKIISLYA